MADEVKTKEELAKEEEERRVKAIADGEKELAALKEEEAELTHLMLLGMPTHGEITLGKDPGKLARWERGHSQYKNRWRYVRGRLGLSTTIDSIRPA